MLFQSMINIPIPTLLRDLLVVFAPVFQAKSLDTALELLPAFVTVLAILEVEFMNGNLLRIAAFAEQLAVAPGSGAYLSVAGKLGMLVDVVDHYGVLFQ